MTGRDAAHQPTVGADGPRAGRSGAQRPKAARMSRIPPGLSTRRCRYRGGVDHRPSLAPRRRRGAARGAARAGRALDGGATVLVRSPAARTRSRSPPPSRSKAPKLGMRAASVTVDHGLQAGVGRMRRTRRRDSATGARPGGARRARRGRRGRRTGGGRARRRATRRSRMPPPTLGAVAVLLGHTLDDQAETVLLGLARGSGAASLQGMAPVSELAPGVALLRPLLEARRDDHACRVRRRGARALGRPAQHRSPVRARARARSGAARARGRARPRHRRRRSRARPRSCARTPRRSTR